MRRAGWGLFGAAVLLPGVWVVAQAAGATDSTFDRWVGWANIHALWVGGLGIALIAFDKVAARPVERAAVDEEKVQRAVTDLAARIEREWAAEAALRDVTRPAPVRVSWSSTDRPAADRQMVLDDPLGGEWQQYPLQGRIDAPNEEIATAFRALPHRHLMVLGAPGAGKSVFAILLTLGLIRRPAEGEPLPVLLAITAWDRAERADAFVIRRLTEDYADVLAGYGDPQTLARHLMEHKRILPIFDGLDELADPADALQALDVFAAAGWPLVVTCRPEEYEQAVRRSRVLSRAAVVELKSVGVDEAIAYLSQPAPDPRWEPVFAHLRAHPDGPLAGALSTPLMVALARGAYQAPSPADPADLLTPAADGPGATHNELPDEAQPADQAALEARLLAAFVPSVYAARPRRAALDRQPVAGVDYRPEQAQRWLTFLARHMREHGTQDVGWSELGQMVRTAFTGLSAFVLASVTALLFGPVFGPVVGLVLATVVGLATAALMAYTGGPPQGRHETKELTPRSALSAERTRTIARGLLGGSAFGALLGLQLAAFLGLELSYAGLVVFVFLSAYALAAMLDHTWGSFLIARVWLFVTGRLPFRLTRFLEDAHRRGVLRQSGARYQFRHLLLQEHLAGGASPPPAAPAAETKPQTRTAVDGERSRWLDWRARLCVAVVSVVFVAFFILAAGHLAPVYRSGDQPEVIQETRCTSTADAGGSITCTQLIAGYRWPVGPGGQTGTTFASPNRPRVLRFRGVDGEFRLSRSEGCAGAVFEWRLDADGQLMRSGEVRAGASTLDASGAAPYQARTITVSARRIDTASCTAYLHWDHPTVRYYGVIPGLASSARE
ncbi:hypothetical protein GCM10010199_08100 [Dactylosporangium roseum]